MPRYSKDDAILSRQRTLFGVDMLERQVYDLTDLLFRVCTLLENTQDVSRGTLLDTVNSQRAQAWLITYADKQRSDLELGGNDGKKV